MAEGLQKQLRDVGSKLQTLPSTEDSLVELLKQAETCLSKLDQVPSKSMLEPIQPFLNAVVKPELLKHQDGGIKLLVATCVCEITRITAPEAPYSDDVLRDIFRLIVTTFSGLSDSSGPSFGRRAAILETLARYRSCVVLLDLECDDLVIEVFSTFFAVVSDDHSENVRTSMQTIMVNLLEESEDVPEDLLLALLSVLGRKKNNVSKAARRLAMNVIENSAVKLEPGIKQFLISSMSGDERVLSTHVDYHEVIYDIYGCAPQILSGVIPYLIEELRAERLDTRLKSVRFLGDLFSFPGYTISEAFQPIFSEFLKRLTDKAVEIRMSVLEHVKMCLLSSPFRAEASQIISALSDRLLDYDENVRKEVVSVVRDVICHTLTSIPVETTKLVAERLKDKSLIIKKHTLERLAEIHKCCCLGVSDGSIKPSQFNWIPGKILRCLYDKDFSSDTIESILCGSLFPAEFSVKDQVEHWVRVFSGFDKVEVKAVEKILEQKQRLQQEMQRYLNLRQMYQDGDTPEFQKKVTFCFRVMSRCFSDSGKAEENFQILGQLKDDNVWKILTTLLDPNTSFLQACSQRDDLLKVVGEKHQLCDFLGMLSIKCSYLPFSKEHVKEFLFEADKQKSAECTQFASSCMNLLVILAHFSPMLLNGTEENLVHLLKDDREVVKEGALHVLAKAGGSIQEQLGASSSSVELMLERICLEGSRRLAKYAVHALAAITKDDGLKSLSVLYKRLVDMLEEKMHLPAVLQSLGCIAQSAMPVFETRESEIEEFIKSKILECSNKVEDDKKVSWDDRSELCSLKIFGIKTLVKSYLPVKDAHLRLGINKLLGILKNLLSFGEISKDIESSSVDKAHLRLASAKAVLRLSRHWDHKIPVDVFHLTLRITEINFPEARKLFLDKVYQYTKDNLLDAKYACAFSFNMIEPQLPELEEDKRKLADIIQMCQQTKAGQLPIQPDAKSEMAYPENILPYFVHALAHHSSCPNVEICKDIKAFEITYRLLQFFLSMMVHGIEDEKSKEGTNKDKEIASIIVSIFQSIKHSEDVVDTSKSKNSHAICDLGLLITKRLAGKKDGLQCLTALVHLPPMLYKSHEKKVDDDTPASEENSWLADESVLIHFESLKLDTDETVQSEKVNGQALNDGEEDGNDLPLGKMLKHLKVQGPKAKTMLKKTSSAVGTKSAVNDVDILKMVREINLDNLGVSSKFESTNGFESLPSKSKTDKKDQKKKRKIVRDTMSIPVPKRRRSSSAQPALKFSLPLRNSKGFLRVSNDDVPEAKVCSSIEMESETCSKLEEKLSAQKSLADPAQSGLLVSCFRKKSSVSSKRKDKGSGRIYNEAEKAEGIHEHDRKKHNLTTETGRIEAINNQKFPMLSAKKRKRRSIAGLAKSSLKEVGNHATDLIDCRVRVWWPMDKQFYEGVVKSYDPKKKKHVVLYDDGDVEVLFLEKERWELIDSSQDPSKRLNLSKSPPSKEVSPAQENNFLGGSYQSKKQNKRVRGKRTPRKNLKHSARGASESKTATDSRVAENEASSDVSTPEPASKADDVISGDLKRDEIEEMDESPKGGEESDAEGKSASEGKRMVDPEGGLSVTDRYEQGEPLVKEKQVEDTSPISSDVNDSGEEVKSHSEEAKPNSSREVSTEESGEEESSKSEGNQTDEDAAGSSTDSDEMDKKTKETSNSHDEEASDNETLNMWRRRAK